LPWEITDQYIRSGHRSPDEFEPNSLRTITLSENEGIKAVVGKPKGEEKMDVQSYLFAISKGWTIEKAKAWFEKHKKNEAHLPIKVLEKIVDKPLRIRGVALKAGVSRNFNIYTPEELQAFAQKLVSAPVYVEHVAVPNAVGKIVKAEWDGSEPIHTSSGLQPDLVVDFDDFILVIESTICSGPRQYDTETEPVIRHIARVVQEYKQKGNPKPVYAFFVAREIDPNVVEYFYVYYAFHKHPLAEEYITVIPLTVSQFKIMFQKLTETKSSANHILHIFEKAGEVKGLEKCNSCGTPQMNVHHWYKKVLKIISEELSLDNLI